MSRARWLLLLVALAALLAHARYYMPFLEDDALISLRYADRLLHGAGLTWTDGHPVEGYSNLLWILLVASLGLCGVNLVTAAIVLGCLCMAAVVVVVTVRYISDRTAALVALVFFVGAAPVAVWAIGGLEQPLCAAALAGVIPLYFAASESGYANRRATMGLSALLGILCLTRPDGPIYTAAVVLTALLNAFLGSRRWSWSFVALVCSVPVLAYAGQLAFRLAYYGEWVPNTALVKLTPSAHHLANGLRYVDTGLLALAPLSILALVYIVRGVARPETRERFTFLAVLAASWLGYLVLIGGDLFPALRHFLPVIVIFTFALAEGVAALAGRRTWATVGLVVLAALYLANQFVNPQSRRAKTERWEWYGRSLALTLKGAFATQQPLMAVTAAGCLPYWSGFPCLDMMGLNDYYLPRHKPADIGSGLLGHELGDAAYVMKCEPDIIVFTVGAELDFRTGKELAANSDFAHRYAKVRIQTAVPPVYAALAWFRIDSPKIGIRRGPDRIIIPGFLFNAYEHTPAILDDGHLVALIDPTHPAGIVVDGVAGAWRAEVQGPFAPDITCKAEPTDRGLRIDLATDNTNGVPVVSVLLTRQP